jgi:CubicO group peptidase (beta-lactamase class C family)
VRDSIAFLQAYGRSGVHADAPPLTTDALFRAGGLSELLNALAVARLAHVGSLDLDAQLSGLIPELPRKLRDVTLDQLLTHTAGLAAEVAVPGRGGADDLGAAARGLTPLDRFAPGGVYSYSAPGIQLVGLAIERAAKRPYATAMREVVLEPLGMQRSTFDFATARQSLTPGWNPSTSPDAPVQPVTFARDTAMRVPLRGFNTTATDAARLAAALMNDGVVGGKRVLPAGVAASLLEPRADVPFSTTRAARGARIALWNGRRAVAVSGGGSGHGVSMQLLPAEGIAVIVLTNKSGVGLSGVADFVFRRLLGDMPAPERAERAPPDSASLDRLAAVTGRYLNGAELIEIVAQDGRPVMKSGDLMLPIRPLEDGAFGALIQGRLALVFRLIEDDDGRPYLGLGNRALAREERP